MSSHYDPPRFVEFVMSLLALLLLGAWLFANKWPFLTLSWSYIIGASTSILMREALVSSSQRQPTRIMVLILFIITFCAVLTYYTTTGKIIVN